MLAHEAGYSSFCSPLVRARFEGAAWWPLGGSLGVCSGAFGGALGFRERYWEPPGSLLLASWGPLGCISGALWERLGPCGRSWEAFGGPFGHRLKWFRVSLGRRGLLGTLWGHLG